MFNTSTKEIYYHLNDSQGHQYSKGTMKFTIPQYGFNIQHMHSWKLFLGY